MPRNNGPRIFDSKSIRFLFGMGWQNNAAAFTKPNSPMRVALAIPSQNDFVAVPKESTLFASWKHDRCAIRARHRVIGIAIPSHFQQTTTPRTFRPRNGSTGHQVTRLQIAPVAGMVRKNLGNSPIHVGKACLTEFLSLGVFLSHLAGRQQDF